MATFGGGRGAAGMALQGNASGGNIIPKGYRLGQIQNFTPEQMGLFKQMFSQASPDSYLSRLAGGEEEIFNQIEAPAFRDFQRIQGQLASRFGGGTGIGEGASQMSSRRGSGFRNTMSSAGTDFAERLAANRHSLQSNALQQLLGLSSSLLGAQPYEQSLIKKKEPFWKQLLLGINEQGRELAPVAAKLAMGGF